MPLPEAQGSTQNNRNHPPAERTFAHGVWPGREETAVAPLPLPPWSQGAQQPFHFKHRSGSFCAPSTSKAPGSCDLAPPLCSIHLKGWTSAPPKKLTAPGFLGTAVSQPTRVVATPLLLSQKPGTNTGAETGAADPGLTQARKREAPGNVYISE